MTMFNDVNMVLMVHANMDLDSSETSAQVLPSNHRNPVLAKYLQVMYSCTCTSTSTFGEVPPGILNLVLVGQSHSTCTAVYMLHVHVNLVRDSCTAVFEAPVLFIPKYSFFFFFFFFF